MRRRAWYHRWPVFVERIGTASSGWHGPPKGTHGPGSQGGQVSEASFSEDQLDAGLSVERRTLVQDAVKHLPQEHVDTVSEVGEFPYGGLGASAKCDRGGGVILNSDREQRKDDVVHEVGHAVQFASGFGYPDVSDHQSVFWELYHKKIGQLTMQTPETVQDAARARIHFRGFPSAYSQWSSEEMFAEGYQMYSSAPKTLQKLSPDVYDYMRDEVFDGVEYVE